MHYFSDIQCIDEMLTFRRSPTWAEAYEVTIDAAVRRDGETLTLVAVSEFSFRILGESIPVPRGLRASWFTYLVYGDRERLLKQLKSPWRQAS